MKGDTNPSLICLAYSTPQEFEKLKEALHNYNMPLRELHLLDISLDIKNYDVQINFLKHFIMNEYWADRNFINAEFKFMGFDVKKKFQEILKTRLGFELIEFKKGEWRNDNKHPLLNSLLCPIAFQNQSIYAETPKEKQAFENLKTFKSEGYEPKISGLIIDK